MASKEAPKTDETKGDAPSIYAFAFKLSKDKIGEKTTNPQVKSKVQEAFLGYGAFDSCRVAGDVGSDREVTIFFARLFAKGQPAYDSLKAGQKVTVKVYDEDVDIALSDDKPSGGGATTGTAGRPKKEAPKGAKAGPKREGGRGRGDRGDRAGGDKPAGAEGDKKDGEGKDGGRGRGRGRGGPKKEEKKESFQRGRANVGGKLGPVSKVRLARQAKEARDKENAARIARGEAPLEDKKKDDEPDPNAPPPKKDAKGGKADAKKDGKKDAGKGDAKKEAAKKAPAKK